MPVLSMRRNYFISEGCSIIMDDYRPLLLENIALGASIIRQAGLLDPKLQSDLESTHWLMENNPPGEALEGFKRISSSGEIATLRYFCS